MIVTGNMPNECIRNKTAPNSKLGIHNNTEIEEALNSVGTCESFVFQKIWDETNLWQHAILVHLFYKRVEDITYFN